MTATQQQYKQFKELKSQTNMTSRRKIEACQRNSMLAAEVNRIDRNLNWFMGKVEVGIGPNDCWIWKKTRNEKGYGRFQISVIKNGIRKAKTVFAHRFSWILRNGPVPQGLCVLHNCPNGDNPACVNPAHLWLGTDLDNNRDRDGKGRWKDHWK